MTGLLGLSLPTLGMPMIIGAVVLTLSAGAGGAWIDHKFMTGAVANAKLETSAVQSSYDRYKASIVINTALTNASTLKETNRLNGLVNDLQSKLAEQQRIADVKSTALQKLLASAKPSDVRPIGPISSAYYDKLRNSP